MERINGINYFEMVIPCNTNHNITELIKYIKHFECIIKAIKEEKNNMYFTFLVPEDKVLLFTNEINCQSNREHKTIMDKLISFLGLK